MQDENEGMILPRAELIAALDGMLTVATARGSRVTCAALRQAIAELSPVTLAGARPIHENRNVLGLAMIFEPLPGQLVTNAFILCAKCRRAIYGANGPRSDALCFVCAEKILPRAAPVASDPV